MSLWLVLAAACVLSSCKESAKVVYVKDYLSEGMLEADAYPAVRQALEECMKTPNSTLVLPGGVLPIQDMHCFEKFMRISNNDPGSKRIAFDIEGVQGLTIEGNGTRLLFSGYISPFYIADSKDICIRDLTIDFTRPFTSEGKVVETGKDWVRLQFPEEAGARIMEGTLRFRDKNRVSFPYGNLLEFDSAKKEVAYHVHDYWIWHGVLADEMPDGTFKIYKEGLTATPGNVLVFGAESRLNPAFTLDGCDGFTLEKVNMWQCCGMGVIAQRSSDLLLDHVQVVPAPGEDKVISISADATHFINCRGYIKMLDCTFMNQKDDATNIHGWYAVTKEQPAADQLVLWSNYGVDFARPGMSLEFVNHHTMMTYDTLKVRDVKKYNDEYSLVTFDESIPDSFELGDALADAEANPDVLISGCYIGNNRARGLLIGSKGHVVIEKNTFHTPGTAILFEGDGNYWYEQSGVKDVTIRDNLFENCMYGSATWGSAVIAVGSGIPDKEHSRYHSGIVVEGNTFRGFDSRIVNLYCVDGFVYRNNTVETSADYPASGDPDKAFVFKYCDNIDIQ